MNNNRKNLFVSISLSILFLFSLLLSVGNEAFTNVRAYDDVNNIWGTQINEFLSRDYAPIKNGKYVGKYYKVGILGMGHHRVVEFGDEISIKTKEVETYTNTCSVGALNGLSITNTVSHCVGQKISTSVQCSIGFSRIIKAVLNFLDFASFGAETGTTIEATIGSETSYWEETITTTSVTYSFDLDNLLDGKTTVRCSKVACFLEAEISKSYTEEQGIFGQWYKVSGTTNQNYIARYYIGDIMTFVYNDNTFGDTIIGEYLVNDTITTF